MKKNITVTLSATPTEEGFSVLAISAGEAKGHGLTFSKSVLQESVPLWDGIPCMLNHDWMPQVENLAGAMHNPTWDENQSGVRLTLIPNGPGADVLNKLREAVKADPAMSKIVGFSAVVGLTYKASGEVTKVNTVRSTDCVIDPARGGKFLSAFNPTTLERSKRMKKKTILSAAQDEDTEYEFSDVDESAARLQGANEHVTRLQKTADESNKVLANICKNLLNSALASSRLPVSVTEQINKRMEARLASGDLDKFSETLENEIKDARDMVTDLTAANSIQGPGRVSGMVTSGDSFSASVYDLMQAERPAELAKVKAARLSGIREMYLVGTGDSFFRGGYSDEAIRMFATTASLPNLLADVLNKKSHDQWNLLAAKGYGWWKNIVSIEHSDNIQDVKGILIGQTDILPTIPEGDAYTELDITDSKESAAWLKKGAYLGLTIEMFLKDDTRKLRAFPRIIGAAGIRTISAWIASKFTENSHAGAAMADGGALFNATAVTTVGGHANLLTTALSAAQWDVVAAAMYNQPMLAPTGADGGIMGIEPAFCLVPRALRATAWDIFKNDWLTTDNKHASNLLKDAAVPLTVPEWTDANNFAAVADPAIAPAITLTEIFGIEPEIYVAGNPNDYAVFMNDESRIKTRHFANVLVEDYRPLHKSNVA